MTNERIGCFLAAVRKERNLTQEQLAERLGVSNRSVSRWENGKTLPDLSLMENICRVLDITISELLNGEKEAEELEMKETVAVVAAMALREREQKAKEVNHCLIPGGLFLAVALGCGWFGVMSRPLEIIAGILGMGLLFAGIFCNNQKQHIADRELELLSQKESDVRMKTAGEMIRFARKTQKTEVKQQRQAFKAIEEVMAEDEYAVFSMTGNDYQWDGHPGPWHISLAVTNKRLLLCGEAIRGRLLTSYIPEWLNREEIRSVACEGRKIFIHAENNVVTIGVEEFAILSEKLKRILKV